MEASKLNGGHEHKIQSIKIKNFRGAQGEASLELGDGSSLLLYGDNGAGKSSFLDAVEWFATNSISHLSGEEVQKIEAMRNVNASDEDESYVGLKLSSSNYSRKFLPPKGQKLNTRDKSEETSEQTFIKNEKVWVRGHDLTSFVLETKKNRLADISNLIGYAEVSKINSILKKSFNGLSRRIEGSGFEKRISYEKEIISQKLGFVVNNEEQFYEAVNDLITKKAPSFSKSKKILSKEKLEEIIEEITKSTDEKEVKYQHSLKDLKTNATKLLEKISQNDLIETFENYLSIVKDIQKKPAASLKISLLALYKEAEKVISSQEDESCPLCNSIIGKDLLVDIIVEKLKNLEAFKAELQFLNIEREKLLGQIKGVCQDIDGIASNAATAFPQNPQRDKLNELFKKLNSLSNEIKKDVQDVDSSKVMSPDFKDAKKSINNICLKIDDYLGDKGNSSSQEKISLLTDIQLSKEAFAKMQKAEKEKNILKKYLDTFKKISSRFNSKQKEEMEKILGKISLNVNKFYDRMSPKNHISNIQLGSTETKGEFSGIVFRLKFFEKNVQSPKSYLSESRLNCLGLSLFLASVVLFNKNIKFLIFDDVISSFDKDHRYRFGQLLKENFNEYQLIVLTHEKEWFNSFAPNVKGLGWIINKIFWDTTTKSIQVEVSLIGYKEEIEDKIKRSDECGLGNLIRKYAEKIFKKICNDLSIPLPFKYNTDNEQRTLEELKKGLISALKKFKGIEVYKENKALFERISDLRNLSNSASHDGEYEENLSDMKAAYEDIESFKNIFICQKCDNFLLQNNHNNLENKQCKCQKT